MNKANEEKLINLYKSYNTVIKPLLSEVEIYRGSFPIELLNEIRALLDHIARCYIENATDEQAAEQLKRAQSHIARTMLDCYKHLIIYFNDKAIEFQNKTKSVDLTTINNGYFSKEYEKKFKDAINQTRIAKQAENQHTTFSEKIEFYECACNNYKLLVDYLSDNQTKVNWARVKRKIITGSTIICNVIIWIVGIVIGAILTNNNTKIIELFLKQ